MLEEGYHVHVDSEALKNPRLSTIGGSTARGPGGEASIEGLEGGMHNSLDILSRVPSQKLSVLIRRKNTLARKERRRKEKQERMRSEMEAEEREAQLMLEEQQQS